MKDIVSPIHWLPFIWILAQALLILSMAMFYLRKTRLLVAPFEGMDYGSVAVVGSILLGAMFISTAAIPAIFLGAKSAQFGVDRILSNTLLLFTQHFLVCAVTEGIFFVSATVNRRFVFKSAERGPGEDNIAWGLMVACLNISVSILLWFWLKELSGSISPQFVNFR